MSNGMQQPEGKFLIWCLSSPSPAPTLKSKRVQVLILPQKACWEKHTEWTQAFDSARVGWRILREDLFLKSPFWVVSRLWGLLAMDLPLCWHCILDQMWAHHARVWNLGPLGISWCPLGTADPSSSPLLAPFPSETWVDQNHLEHNEEEILFDILW